VFGYELTMSALQVILMLNSSTWDMWHMLPSRRTFEHLRDGKLEVKSH